MTPSDSLLIERITIENFRPYEKLDAVLSTDNKKTITIISGSNSLGKTSLMNALYWCLYGEEPFFLNQGEGKPLVNQKALNDTSVGKSVITKVKIAFSDGKRVIHDVTRELKLTRQHDGRDKVYRSIIGGQIDSGFTWEETVNYEGLKSDGNWKVTNNTHEVSAEINRIIPKDLSEFIFFNGEMLDTFFREKGESRIRTGIEQVTGLSVTDRSIANWTKMEKNYSKRAAQSSGMGGSNEQDKKDEWEEKLESFIFQKNEIQKQINELKPREKELQSILENHPHELIKHLRQQLEEEKEHKIEYQKAKERINLDRTNFITKYFSPLLLNKPSLDTYQIIKDAEIAGEIPPPINPSLLSEKIEEGICFCGNDLREDQDAKKNLVELLNQVKNSVLASTAAEGKEALNRLLQIPNTTQIKDILNNFRAEFDEYAQKFENANNKIIGITQQLKDYPEDKIRELGNELAEIHQKTFRYHSDLVRIEQKIDAAKATIEISDKKITDATKQSKASKKWTDKAELARKAREILEDLREDLLSEIRETVEKRTEEIWKKLISRHWQLDKISIDDEYKIRVIDKEGVDNLKTLSAGQTLYLALSFISAIREVTDTNYLMMIDSPFGKVSGHERIWAAQDLPEFLPDTQMTFLVTNTEYDAETTDLETGEKIDSIRNVLRKNNKLWKEYVLKLTKTSESSSKTIMDEVQIR